MGRQIPSSPHVAFPCAPVALFANSPDRVTYPVTAGRDTGACGDPTRPKRDESDRASK